MDLVTIFSHLIGPGSIKGTLKVANHIAGDGRFDEAIDSIQRFTDSPAWTKHRIDNAMDTWDDHKEDVYDFFDNAGEIISDTASSIAEGVGDFFGSLFD